MKSNMAQVMLALCAIASSMWVANTELSCSKEKSVEVKLLFSELKQDSFSVKELPVLKYEFPAQNMVKVLAREKSANLKYNSLTHASEYVGLFQLPPTKEEAVSWVKRDQCEIGSDCLPGGDCWGSDAQKCREEGKGTWVNRKAALASLPSWDIQWYRTCVMSWGCSLDTVELTNHFDPADRNLYVIVSNKMMKVDSETPYIATRDASFVATQTKPSKTQITLHCIEKGKRKYCADKTIVPYAHLEFSGEHCQTYGSSAYCLENPGDGHMVVELPTTSDTYLTHHGFAEFLKGLNADKQLLDYNSYQLQKSIIELQEMMGRMIYSASRSNKFILYDFFGIPSIAEHSTRGLKMKKCSSSAKNKLWLDSTNNKCGNSSKQVCMRLGDRRSWEDITDTGDVFETNRDVIAETADERRKEREESTYDSHSSKAGDLWGTSLDSCLDFFLTPMMIKVLTIINTAWLILRK